MMEPISKGAVPPGGYWRYRDPDLGVDIAHPYYVQVKAQAHALRKKSGLPIPWNWDAWFDEQVCKETPKGCFEVPEAKENGKPSISEMATHFANSMKEWARSGFKVVTLDVFKDRSRICQGDPDTPRCDHYQTSGLFGIARCGKCGCTRLKLGMATEKCPLGKW